MHNKTSIVFITNHIPIYRKPIYEELHKIYNIEILTSNPIEKSDESAVNKLPIKTIGGFNFRQKLKFKHIKSVQEENVSIPITLFFDLAKIKPRIIVSSEFGLRSLIALIYSKLTKKTYILSSEEIESSAKAIGYSRKLLRKILFSQADAFLAWGLPANEYLIRKGIDQSKIYLCTQAVDNNHWNKGPTTIEREKLREKFHVKGKLFLAIGRLVKRKGFDLLLNSWAALPDEVKSNNSLMLIGDGPEKNDILDLADRHSLENFTHIDWRSYDELPIYYGIADVFVFPSLIDVWGLVVNEALASGLPVIASKYAGSSQQLINPSPSHLGEQFDPLNQQNFTSTMYKWIKKDTSDTEIYAQNRISEINFDVSINSIKKILNQYLV